MANKEVKVVPTPAAKPVAEAKPAESARELTVKEAIYQKIADYIKLKTGKNIGRTGGQDAFNLTVHEIFAAATAHGSIRLNGGFGSLKVKEYTSGSRKLPSGAVTTFGPRKKMRYEQGVSVTNMIVGGPDIASTPPAEAPPPPAKAPEGSVDLS